MEDTPAAAIRAGVGRGARVVPLGQRSLMQYAQLSFIGTASCIRRPTMQANNFELKPSYVQMI